MILVGPGYWLVLIGLSILYLFYSTYVNFSTTYLTTNSSKGSGVSAPSPIDFSVIYYKNNHSPYYVTGLVDGEGSFGLYLAKDSSTRSGYQIQATFQRTLHKNDYALLEMVKEYFGVGGIYKDGDRYIKYSVRSLKDLAIIIKHFEEYPLLTQKRADFYLVKDSVQLMLNRSHITEEGLKK